MPIEELPRLPATAVKQIATANQMMDVHQHETSNRTSQSTSRPRRTVASKTSDEYHGLLWTEEKELKKALYASLCVSKKSTRDDEDDDEGSDMGKDKGAKKRKTAGLNKQGDRSDDDGSNAKRTKVHAQRKFAQGSNPSSPTVTPVKQRRPSATPSVDLHHVKRPKTEDFLTFLCLRGTPLLPPSLDYLNTPTRRHEVCRSTHNGVDVQHQVDKAKPVNRSPSNQSFGVKAAATKPASKPLATKPDRGTSEVTSEAASQKQKRLFSKDDHCSDSSASDPEDPTFLPSSIKKEPDGATASASVSPTWTTTETSAKVSVHALRHKYRQQRLAKEHGSELARSSSAPGQRKPDSALVVDSPSKDVASRHKKFPVVTETNGKVGAKKKKKKVTESVVVHQQPSASESKPVTRHAASLLLNNARKGEKDAKSKSSPASKSSSPKSAAAAVQDRPRDHVDLPLLESEHSYVKRLPTNVDEEEDVNVDVPLEDRIEPSLDFSSDDEIPLAKRPKKSGPKVKVDSTTSKLRTRSSTDPPVASVTNDDVPRTATGRPSRKTKEAATAYLELLGRKLNASDDYDFDMPDRRDAMSSKTSVSKVQQPGSTSTKKPKTTKPSRLGRPPANDLQGSSKTSKAWQSSKDHQRSSSKTSKVWPSSNVVSKKASSLATSGSITAATTSAVDSKTQKHVVVLPPPRKMVTRSSSDATSLTTTTTSTCATTLERRDPVKTREFMKKLSEAQFKMARAQYGEEDDDNDDDVRDVNGGAVGISGDPTSKGRRGRPRDRTQLAKKALKNRMRTIAKPMSKRTFSKEISSGKMSKSSRHKSGASAAMSRRLKKKKKKKKSKVRRKKRTKNTRDATSKSPKQNRPKGTGDSKSKSDKGSFRSSKKPAAKSSHKTLHRRSRIGSGDVEPQGLAVSKCGRPLKSVHHAEFDVISLSSTTSSSSSSSSSSWSSMSVSSATSSSSSSTSSTSSSSSSSTSSTSDYSDIEQDLEQMLEEDNPSKPETTTISVRQNVPSNSVAIQVNLLMNDISDLDDEFWEPGFMDADIENLFSMDRVVTPTLSKGLSPPARTAGQGQRTSWTTPDGETTDDPSKRRSGNTTPVLKRSSATPEESSKSSSSKQLRTTTTTPSSKQQQPPHSIAIASCSGAQRQSSPLATVAGCSKRQDTDYDRLEQSESDSYDDDDDVGGEEMGENGDGKSFSKDAASVAEVTNAPTYFPNSQEFLDPLAFIEKIRPDAEKYGVCKIIPPVSFKPECKVSDDMRFTAHNQYVHKMLHRQGPNEQKLACIRKHLEAQGIEFDNPPLIGGMELDLPRLFQTVQYYGGLKAVIEKKKWQKVADSMKIAKSAQDRVTKLYDAYCKFLLPYDTLSAEEKLRLEQQVCSERRRRGRAGESNEECVTKGRSMSLGAFYRIARNTMAMWFKNDQPKPTEVEQEYWRCVTERSHHLCVNAGNVDSSTYGYGFPTSKNNPYSKHPWNLKVLTNNPASILRCMGPVMGVTIPTLHVGMLFTTGCWYADLHSLPWIEFLHSGASKIWYGVPASQSSKFREAMSSVVPDYCTKTPIWLPSDTAMVPPSVLVERGASLCRLVQNSGEFVVVFPRAFTSTVCCGYSISESVYFAGPSWLGMAPSIFKEIADSCEPAVFPLQRLVIGVAGDSADCVSLDVLKEILPLIKEIRNDEVSLRKQLYGLGLKQLERTSIDEAKNSKRKPAEDAECEICRTNCYISLVRCSQDGVYCLRHAIEHLQKKKKDLKFCTLIYLYDQAELNDLVRRTSDRILQLDGCSKSARPTTSKKSAKSPRTS